MNRLIRFAISVWMISLFVGLAPRPSHAITIGFEPAAASVSLGDTLDVAVMISGLGGEIVSAYDLDIGYDPSILSATGVSFGSLLNGSDPLNSFQIFDLSTPGVIDLAELSLLSDLDLAGLQSDTFALATLSFSTLAVGTSPLNFVPDPVFGIDVKGSNAQVLQLDVQRGSVTVAASVPEPNTLMLLGAGLVFALLMSRALRPSSNFQG